MSTQDIINARRQLIERGANSQNVVDFIAGTSQPVKSDDPFDNVVPEWVTASYGCPPGAMAEFCQVIADHFEVRFGGEKMRIVGAINAAQLIMGNHVLSPDGTKMMFNTVVAAPSGSGKGAPIDFVSDMAFALGLEDRISVNAKTSMKQVQEAALQSGGFLLYNVDDNANHVKAWSNTQNGAFGEFDGFLRTMATQRAPFVAPSPLMRDVMESVSKVLSAKFIGEDSSEKGYIIPRKPGKDGEQGAIDFVAISKMDNDIGRRVRAAMKLRDTVMNPVKNFKIVANITMTPEYLEQFIPAWAANGSAGRAFFVFSGEEVGDLQPRSISRAIPRKIINEWKPRIPTNELRMKWKSPEVEDKVMSLRLAIDQLRHINGIVGGIATRSAQLMIDLSCVCAFLDESARNGVTDILVDQRHVEWGFMAAVESLRSYRNYSEGEVESDGLATTEFQNLVARVRKITETKAFQDSPTVSVIRNRLYNGKAKNVINGMGTPSERVTPEDAVRLLLEQIAESKRPPFIIDDANPNRILMTTNGDWENIYPQGRLFTLLNRSLAQLKFVITRKK